MMPPVENRESSITSLTDSELGAIHQLLQAAAGLLAATGASELVVTYPTRSAPARPLRDAVRRN
jgi:hypothetical protein